MDRPITLLILDGWGYAPRTDGNAVAIAHTPYYDEICRAFPMTTLTAAVRGAGQAAEANGNAEIGHLTLGTGRAAQTESSRIDHAIRTGEFMENPVIARAFDRAVQNNSAVHFIGLISDAGVHSATENLFACLRLAKARGLTKVYIHCILDGVDVPPRTADVYVEALEIKLADIGVGRIATLCGRFFAMDDDENWERTARAFTMLVHAEGERALDPVAAIRNSFLRGISDEFIAPIVIERGLDVPVAKIANDDLVVFFNHRAEPIRQLVRSLCVPEGASGTKPAVDTVCLTEYDPAFNLPAAFRSEPEKNTLVSVLSAAGIPSVKITEGSRRAHLTTFFDGGREGIESQDQQIIIADGSAPFGPQPESASFKITDEYRRATTAAPGSFFVVNMPAAAIAAETGDLHKTAAAIQYIDTCLGGVCERARELGGVVLITSTHGTCEEMVHSASGDPNPSVTANPVPFHYVDYAKAIRLGDGGSLADVAPTILGMVGIEKPAEMTGSDLRKF